MMLCYAQIYDKIALEMTEMKEDKLGDLSMELSVEVLKLVPLESGSEAAKNRLERVVR